MGFEIKDIMHVEKVELKVVVFEARSKSRLALETFTDSLGSGTKGYYVERNFDAFRSLVKVKVIVPPRTTPEEVKNRIKIAAKSYNVEII